MSKLRKNIKKVLPSMLLVLLLWLGMFGTSKAICFKVKDIKHGDQRIAWLRQGFIFHPHIIVFAKIKNKDSDNEYLKFHAQTRKYVVCISPLPLIDAEPMRMEDYLFSIGMAIPDFYEIRELLI